MPKSKTDKTRKDNLLKYKKSKKMSKAVPEMKPFRQIPTWESSEKFEIEGSELESLYNFFNIFAPLVTTVQQIFSRGLADGKIKMNYEYEDGKSVPTEEVEEYTKKLNEYFAQKQADLNKKEPFSEAPIPPDGEPVAEAKVLSLVD